MVGFAVADVEVSVGAMEAGEEAGATIRARVGTSDSAEARTLHGPPLQLHFMSDERS